MQYQVEYKVVYIGPYTDLLEVQEKVNQYAREGFVATLMNDRLILMEKFEQIDQD